VGSAAAPVPIRLPTGGHGGAQDPFTLQGRTSGAPGSTRAGAPETTAVFVAHRLRISDRRTRGVRRVIGSMTRFGWEVVETLGLSPLGLGRPSRACWHSELGAAANQVAATAAESHRPGSKLRQKVSRYPRAA
jgi:hypothetical protein